MKTQEARNVIVAQETRNLHIVPRTASNEDESLLGKNVVDSCHTRGMYAGSICAETTAGDFVYSESRDLVGFVRAVDARRGTMDIHLGVGIVRFFEVGNKLVRPNWDAEKLTYAWESVVVLRDE